LTSIGRKFLRLALVPDEMYELASQDDYYYTTRSTVVLLYPHSIFTEATNPVGRIISIGVKAYALVQLNATLGA
jgi:hypothetical protein